MNETVLTAVGNLASDVDYRVTPNGIPVAGFRLACNERRWDRQEGYSDGDTFFIRVNCWRTLADRVQGVLRKGDPVVVRGRIVSRSYDDREGIRRFVTELEANAVGADVGRVGVVLTRRRRDEPIGEAAPDVPTDVRPDVPAHEESAEGPASTHWDAEDEQIGEPAEEDFEEFGAERAEVLPAAGR